MRSRQSNLHYFFLFLLILIGFSSCSKGTDINEIVPYTRVIFQTYRNYHQELEDIGTGVYFGPDSPFFNSSAGYRNHGIYIVNTGSDFISMDATCTHDADSTQHVILKEDDPYIGVCPICKSEYIFLSEGAVHKGPAKYSLRNYRVTYNPETNEIRVTN